MRKSNIIHGTGGRYWVMLHLTHSRITLRVHFRRGKPDLFSDAREFDLFYYPAVEIVGVPETRLAA
jgi:hypothetical protein